MYGFLLGFMHKCIPTVYDVYDTDDGQLVLEEFISGVTVGEILKTGKYTYDGAKAVLSEICSALGFLHENGFVHRDIKPSNIMITASGSCKLLDFDASRAFDKNKEADTDVLGTVGYAPPEQYGITQSDARSDIYALGVLLNVMLTGNHPSECIAPGKAGRIVRRCTQINPDERYSDIEEFKRSL